jgi:hypothetical protein
VADRPRVPAAIFFEDHCMTHTRLSLAVAGFATIASLGIVVAGDDKPAPRSPLAAQQPAAGQPQAPAAPRRKDRTKRIVEMPVKNVLAAKSAVAPTGTRAAFVNPKVEPGKVRWHADFAAALAASAKSKKPILLFQMMGKLDEKFC